MWRMTQVMEKETTNQFVIHITTVPKSVPFICSLHFISHPLVRLPVTISWCFFFILYIHQSLNLCHPAALELGLSIPKCQRGKMVWPYFSSTSKTSVCSVRTCEININHHCTCRNLNVCVCVVCEGQMSSQISHTQHLEYIWCVSVL